jgi:hypothetical protein
MITRTHDNTGPEASQHGVGRREMKEGAAPRRAAPGERYADVNSVGR